MSSETKGHSAAGRLWAAAIVAVGIGLLTTAMAQTVDITRPARVIDGDGLQISGRSIRLQGIDAPELDQICTLDNGTNWPCGKLSRGALQSLVIGSNVSCRPEGNDRYGRTLAVCQVGGLDINAEMVRHGYALALRIPAVRAALRGIPRIVEHRTYGQAYEQCFRAS